LRNESLSAISNFAVAHLTSYTEKSKYSSIDKKKMILGMEILLINLSKGFVIYGGALLLGCFFKTLAIHLAFAATKRYSYGLHAKHSAVCTIYSFTIFVLLTYVTPFIPINNVIALSIFALIITMHVKYAPADTQARPIIGANRRRYLKRMSVSMVIVLMIFTMTVPYIELKTLFVLGAVCQTISILPITYRILERRERNYEIYEQ